MHLYFSKQANAKTGHLGADRGKPGSRRYFYKTFYNLTLEQAIRKAATLVSRPTEMKVWHRVGSKRVGLTDTVTDTVTVKPLQPPERARGPMAKTTKKTRKPAEANGSAPSFREEVARIQREAEQATQSRIAELARTHAKRALGELSRHIRDSKDGTLRVLWNNYKSASAAAGEDNGGGSVTSKTAGATGGRQRRSQDEIKANAERAAQALKTAGKDGLTGNDLRAKGVDTGGLAEAVKRFDLGKVEVEGRGPGAKYTLA
jgi:hypothetical protein